jgi:hypothetical protein
VESHTVGLKSVLWIGSLLIGVLCLYGAGRLYYRLTDGFKIGNIIHELPHRSDWVTRPLTAEEKAELDQAIHQSYHYLGKGHQAYIFESQDGQYVIKFLKFQRLRIPRWLLNIPLPSSWEKRRKEKIIFKQEILNRLFLSWKIGFEELKEEAAIIYIHLNKTSDLNKSLTIKDKIGLIHTLDLDQLVFLIQKKASPLCPTLDRLVAEGKVNEAKILLRKLIGLLVSEYRQGLAEKELHLLRNMGVLKGKPIHIDNGRFERDDTLQEPILYSRELWRKTAELREWLNRYHPDLAADFEVELQRQTPAIL